MKRKLFALLAALALFLSLSAGASADGASLACTVIAQSEDIYDIAIEALGVENAAMMQFSLYYDASELSVLDVQSGKLFERNQAAVVNGQIPGEIHLVWVSLNPLSESGTAMVLRVQKIASGDVRVSFDPETIIIADPSRNHYDVNCSDCVIEGTIFPEAESVHNDLPETARTEDTFTAPQSAAAVTQAAEPAQPVQTAAVSSMVVTQGTSNGMTMSEPQATIGTGESRKMSIVESQPELIWSSSNEQVAVVDDSGVVTAFHAGTAVITASTLEGDAYASSVIMVEGEQTPLAVITPNAVLTTVPSAAPTQAMKPAETSVVSPSPVKESAIPTSAPTVQPSPNASPAVTAAPHEAEKSSVPYAFALAMFATAVVILVIVIKRKK